MKYIVKTESEKEIDLEFPHYTNGGNAMYCILSPSKTIAIYPQTNCIDNYSCIIGAEYESMRESEYMTTFDKIMGNILKDLNR
jgi:hypothetical protein